MAFVFVASTKVNEKRKNLCCGVAHFHCIAFLTVPTSVSFCVASTLPSFFLCVFAFDFIVFCHSHSTTTNNNNNNNNGGNGQRAMTKTKMLFCFVHIAFKDFSRRRRHHRRSHRHLGSTLESCRFEHGYCRTIQFGCAMRYAADSTRAINLFFLNNCAPMVRARNHFLLRTFSHLHRVSFVLPIHSLNLFVAMSFHSMSIGDVDVPIWLNMKNRRCKQNITLSRSEMIMKRRHVCSFH